MKTQLLFLFFCLSPIFAKDGSTSQLTFPKNYSSLFSREKQLSDNKNTDPNLENNVYIGGILNNPPTEFLANVIPSNGTYPGNTGEFFDGYFYNHGTNVIHSYTLQWQVDQGPIVSEYFTGLSIAPNQIHTYANTIPTVGLSNISGKHTLTIWITNPNNVPDPTPYNNTFTKTFYAFSEFFPPKTVVYEYITGTWCNSCVRGYPILKDMKHYHPDFIGIAVHGGNDPMVNQNYYMNMVYFCTNAVFPSGSVNRTTCQTLIDYMSLENEYNIERSKKTYGKIGISTQSWDPITRTITVQTASRFPMNISCDYDLCFRQGLIVVEDDVTGTSSEYEQLNGYFGSGIDLYDWQSINWSTLGNPIPSSYMVYNHVARALLSDSYIPSYGLASSSIPMSITYNIPYNYVFTHVLPIEQDEHKIKLIAVLYHSYTGQIVNAKEVPLSLSALSMEEVEPKLTVSIYPNPSNGNFYFKTQKNFNLSIADLLGKEVFNSKNNANESEINLTHLESGIYLAHIQNEDGILTKKIMIN